MKYLGWRPVTDRCSWNVSLPDPFPWEHNNKKYLRQCRCRVSWEHEGKLLCTHHAKTLALRALVENLSDFQHKDPSP